MDPSGQPRLSIELVPAPLWGRNLRDQLASAEWKRLRRWALDRADNRCEVCGLYVDGGRNLVCHERWRYEPAGECWRQTLVDVRIHCRLCDAATHIGRLHQYGMAAVAPALHQLTALNGWTGAETRAHYSRAIRRWRELSEIPTDRWTQDLSWYDRWRQEHADDS